MLNNAPLLHLILVIVLLQLVSGAAAVALSRRPGAGTLIYGFNLIACAAVTCAAVYALAIDHTALDQRATLPLGLPWLHTRFRMDSLSAFFLFVVNLGGASASLFAMGYGRHDREPARTLPPYPAYLAAMSLVVLADDAFAFLVAWEFMSLMSWLLVLANHREPGNTHAAFVYVVMASLGTIALFLAFGLLAGPDGDYAFEAMRAQRHSGGLAVIVLLLATLGAGSKAGLVPLHAWLPLAHPAAPSHVSALMSGVMTKVAVYGFIRIVFDLNEEPDWWWGGAVLAVAGLTAVLGVLSALMQHDLKRLLAFHTVENIGIIFIGLGLALAFRANNMPGAEALAFTAALFHVFNHSVFKSLLFFGSGAVLVATAERDMEHLGGLVHRMPGTAFTFLIGAAAISALPPLNGFVSEWLILRAVILSPDLPQWALRFLVPAVGAVLALSAALAAACFVKAFGITFLGRPRSQAAAQAKETDGFSLAAMGWLAGLCIAAGVMPIALIKLIDPVTERITTSAGGWAGGSDALWLIPISPEAGTYSGLVILAAIAIVATLTVVGVHRLAGRAVRRAPVWDCGFPDANPLTQYTSGSFAQPVRRVFGPIAFGAREHVTMPKPGDLSPARIEVSLRDFAWEWFYVPTARVVLAAATRLNVVQFMTIRRYLSFMFAALLTLLFVVALWR